MGTRNGPHDADFPVGTVVQIADRETLLAFQRPVWSFHDPLTDEQVECAGQVARVGSVGYYHGGDELYGLEGLPGLWHERCLLTLESGKVE